jgi:hypothetical protein
MKQTGNFLSRGFWSEFFSRKTWSFKNVKRDILSCIAFLSCLILFIVFREILQAWFSKSVSLALALTILIPCYFVLPRRRISFKKYILLVIAGMIVIFLLGLLTGA